jgi:hypothetical protein
MHKNGKKDPKEEREKERVMFKHGAKERRERKLRCARVLKAARCEMRGVERMEREHGRSGRQNPSSCLNRARVSASMGKEDGLRCALMQLPHAIQALLASILAGLAFRLKSACDRVACICQTSCSCSALGQYDGLIQLRLRLLLAFGRCACQLCSVGVPLLRLRPLAESIRAASRWAFSAKSMAFPSRSCRKTGCICITSLTAKQTACFLHCWSLLLELLNSRCLVRDRDHTMISSEWAHEGACRSGDD